MSVDIINHKSLFAKDSIMWLRLIILIQLIFLGSLVGFIIMQFKEAPTPVYFPLKKGDHLINAVPLDKPSLTDAELLNWVTEAMIVSFSFNYHNYDKITEKIDEFFDSMGMNSYLKMITDHKQIQQVVNKKLILSGRPTGAPRIVKDEVVNGIYGWQINLPFILKFRSQQLKSDLELVLDIFIVRVSEQVAPLGVKIIQLQDVANINKSNTSENSAINTPVIPSNQSSNQSSNQPVNQPSNQNDSVTKTSEQH